MPNPSWSSTPPRPVRLPGGLVYVSPDLPGLSRVATGEKTFRYRLPDGQWLKDEAAITEQLEILAQQE